MCSQGLRFPNCLSGCPHTRSFLEPRWEADNERPARKLLFIALRAACYRKGVLSKRRDKKSGVPPFASFSFHSIKLILAHFTEVDTQGLLEILSLVNISSSSYQWCHPNTRCFKHIVYILRLSQPKSSAVKILHLK